MEQLPQPTSLPPDASRQRPPLALGLIVAGALVAATSYVRLVLLADYVLPVAYSVPLLVMLWFRDRRLVWGMALAFAVITAVRYGSDEPLLGAPTPAMRALDWSLILVELLAVSAIMHAFIGAMESHERANQRIQAANAELLTHQRQVAAQNEQLRWHAQELRQATERSQQREQILEAVLTTTPLGIAITDARLREVRLNPAAAALLGLPSAANVAGPADMLTGLRFLRDGQALPPRQHPIARAAYHGERIVNEELQLLLPDGRCDTLLVSAAPIGAGSDAAAMITGAVAALVDISDQKLLQQELDRRRQEAEESSSRKTRFLAAVSHDIRTPANAINLMAELLQRASSSSAVPKDIADLAGEVRSSAVALVNLVSDVLDVTRFDSGRIELADSDFSLGPLVEEQCRHLALLAGQRGLTFECRQPQPPVWIRADRIKLGRILDNLVDNAIKYTPAGAVCVTARMADDGGVQIDVADTGLGIPPEQQAGIFDEFVQLRNPQRDRNRGTGLGLAISKRLATAMGGDLTVQSEVGRGSTFTLMLPASRVVQPPVQDPEQTTVSPEAQVRPATSLTGLRVLLVEDHESTRRATARLLNQEGAQVTQAAEGGAALRLLHAEPHPQVLLLDMVLPDLDGAEVLRRLRQDRPPALQAILVLTGDIAPDRTDEVRQLGADALIAKPVDAQKLVEALRQRVSPQPQPSSGEAPPLSR